ncbi:putative ribonuclease H-like domain-containing protein [Tanacetum coccineum]
MKTLNNGIEAGHVNFKNLNKLVKGNLVRGLPSKIFQNDHTCVACQKGKQHKASCKAKAIGKPIKITRYDHKNDNGTEFKNKEVIEFCGIKGIKREYSNARTPQQNGVAERKNRTLIEASKDHAWQIYKKELTHKDFIIVYLLFPVSNKNPQDLEALKMKLVDLLCKKMLQFEIQKDKYVAEILKKFDFANVKTASTPIETQKPLVKDEEASDVDVHLYRSMIGSLMYYLLLYLTLWLQSYACSRILGHQSKELPSKCYSDYAGANLDRKSTTEGCQFLGRRLISCQCKKQTIVATSTTEAEYVAVASCYGQVLWIQNQMHHFIRDAYEKKLIQVLKIHTDDNVADLLTKAFDVSRNKFTIGVVFLEELWKFLRCLKGFRELLSRATNGTEALLLPTLFFLWLDKVSTASVKLVPLGKVCTALEMLKKNTAEALISTFTTLSISSTMAVLDSCPKHNMVAYLEKSEGNEEFHDIIDFLKRSSIHFALTVSPTVSTTFVEQFWTSAKSKTINNLGFTYWPK